MKRRADYLLSLAMKKIEENEKPEEMSQNHKKFEVNPQLDVNMPSVSNSDYLTPKQYVNLEPVQPTITFSPFSIMNLVGNYSEPSSVLREEEYDNLQGPKSACLPLRESPVFDMEIPSVTSSDFNDYPNPPSSILKEPSSLDDFCVSDSSWIPDTDEECVANSKKKQKVSSFRVPDSDATSISSTTELINVPKSSQADSPSLLDNNVDKILYCLESSEHDEKVVSSSNLQINKLTHSRWKKSDLSKWKINTNKNNKHDGRPYLSKSGKTMPAKQPQLSSCRQNCRFGCRNFSEEDREILCRSYWALKTYKEQKQFILQHIKQQKPKRNYSVVKTKNRNISRKYHFTKNDEEIRVCSSFFMATLSISNGPINKAFMDVNEFGLYDGNDNRGRRPPKNKSKPEDVQFIREHIEKFPKMQSHYCRKSSKRFYLDQNLSISKMYELYRQACTAENRIPLSKSKYKQIFGTEYNYSFFVPKKDQCSTCYKYKNDRQKYETIYLEHQERKKAAEEAKQRDKERSQNDDSFLSVTVDLQSVLQIPSGDVGELYYVRKLCVYNFTIYESKTPNKAFCFMWNELNGKRGSSEIATCLKKRLDQIPSKIKEVSIYSDTCSGQNRNQFVAAFLVNYIQFSNLDIIEQKYLESGHTMMEIDSMHSAIEHERKRTSIFSMNDWKNVAKRARSKRNRKDAPPYEVSEMKYNEVIDTKALSVMSIANKFVAQDSKKLQWLKVKCLRYEKENPGVIKFRYGHSGEYSILDIKQKMTRKKSKSGLTVSSPFDIPKAYSSILPITKAKKNDLMELCRKDIFPSEYHAWIQSLPVQSQEGSDKLPEPDILENTDGEDDN